MDKVQIFTRKFKHVASCATELDVVYTNDIAEVERTIKMYKGLLAGEEEKFIGLGFEYTDGIKYKEEVAVVQLGLRLHVFVFQLPRYEGRLYSIFFWVFLFQI